MLNKINGAVTCIVIAMSAAGIAVAEETPASTTTAVVDMKTVLGGKAVDLDALARQRGGTDPGPVSVMKLNGVVANNSASNLSTGANYITDGALAGVSGVPLVVQNSGNNVLIQSATIINVQVK